MSVPMSKVMANKRYRSKTYDTIGFDVKKGKRDEYKAFAAMLNLSLAAFLTVAADEYARNHIADGVPAGEIAAGISTTAPAEKITAEQRRLIDATDDLTPNERRALLKFLELLKARAGS